MFRSSRLCETAGRTPTSATAAIARNRFIVHLLDIGTETDARARRFTRQPKDWDCNRSVVNRHCREHCNGLTECIGGGCGSISSLQRLEGGGFPKTDSFE